MSGRRKKHGHEEHHVDERWLVSYADMITVLMALFIVLYAMSVVDQKKFDVLKNSLATGFGVTKTEKLDENKSIVPKKYVKKNGSGLSATTLTQAQVAQQITKALDKQGLGGTAHVAHDGTSVTVSLVGSRAYFDGNEATLRPETKHVLKAIAPVIKQHEPESITVEGHADPHGSAGSYGTDWNLAAARATSVLVWLVDHDAADPKSISSISYGSEKSVKGTSHGATQKNRRVDIVLHKAAPAVAEEVEAADESASSGHGESASTEESGHGESASTEESSSSHESTSTEESSSHEATTSTH